MRYLLLLLFLSSTAFAWPHQQMDSHGSAPRFSGVCPAKTAEAVFPDLCKAAVEFQFRKYLRPAPSESKSKAYCGCLQNTFNIQSALAGSCAAIDVRVVFHDRAVKACGKELDL